MGLLGGDHGVPHLHLLQLVDGRTAAPPGAGGGGAEVEEGEEEEHSPHPHRAQEQGHLHQVHHLGWPGDHDDGSDDCEDGYWKWMIDDRDNKDNVIYNVFINILMTISKVKDLR